MNYEEARVYLEETSKYGSVLGLENMRELLGRLGNPQNDLRFIHISGTNGKGSVLAYLSTILSGAGYKTGRYVSPTLFSYRERIQVDGKRIEKESLAAHVTTIAKAVEDMKEQQAGTPTAFEVETALAFLYFKEQNCDLVVLETGLGGALDATNVIETPVLEVITSISMDHMEFLGDTLEEIAGQKAGIIKPNTAVVCAKQKREAEKVIQSVCKEKNCVLKTVDTTRIRDIHYGYERQSFTYKHWKNVEIALAGSYQILNGALALEATQMLGKVGYPLTEAQIYEGMKQTRWRGRFTLISRQPRVILDGAHNPAAAMELRESINLYFPKEELHYIFGVFADKDYEKIISITAPLAKHIITVQTPGNPRALPAEKLKEAVEKVNPSAEAAGSIREAVKKSLKNAGEKGVILIFGSLSFLGEAQREVEKETNCGGEKYHG